MKNRVAYACLTISLACFGFDLYHFSHHLGHDPTLLELEGVHLKVIWKIILFMGVLTLLIFSRWLRFLGLTALVLSWRGTPCFSAMSRESCERARGFMMESGVARDAKENFFGRLKITPPRSSFPPEMDKVTWWGTFKPFEFWESPKFEAVWINPRGEPVNRSYFRGGQCQLAKTTLPVNQLPERRLEPGMWRVIVSCEDVVIDNHPFPIVGSAPSPGDAGTARDSGVMIWADDVRNN